MHVHYRVGNYTILTLGRSESTRKLLIGEMVGGVDDVHVGSGNAAGGEFYVA